MSKLSLGDARAYYLSTAKNELGVVSAQSIAGMPWCIVQFIYRKYNEPLTTSSGLAKL
jgi:exosome complex RNA-binding protein Csl4